MFFFFSLSTLLLCFRLCFVWENYVNDAIVANDEAAGRVSARCDTTFTRMHISGRRRWHSENLIALFITIHAQTHTHTPTDWQQTFPKHRKTFRSIFHWTRMFFFSFRILFKASNATENNNNSLYFDFIGIQMRRARQNITCLALYTVAPVIQTYITAHEPKHSLMLLRRNAT